MAKFTEFSLVARRVQTQAERGGWWLQSQSERVTAISGDVFLRFTRGREHLWVSYQSGMEEWPSRMQWGHPEKMTESYSMPGSDSSLCGDHAAEIVKGHILKRVEFFLSPSTRVDPKPEFPDEADRKRFGWGEHSLNDLAMIHFRGELVWCSERERLVKPEDNPVPYVPPRRRSTSRRLPTS
jgi:hypothetical protein